MNTIASTEFRQIEVARLVFSATGSQAERRKHFDKAAIKELASNVKQQGVIQPIVVRPMSLAKHLHPTADIQAFEIIAGERRVMAAREAGLERVPAMIHQLTDDQAGEVQLVENLQREDLHELAEAEGYEQLLKRGMSAEQIADKVAKSKSHVYARMKLIALCPVAREAFYEGSLSASTALLIARIPALELQERAVKRITEVCPYRKVSMSFREAQDYVRDEFTLKLAGAPFPREDLELVAGAGACSTCPKRTGNQPADLFGDIKSADVCTDPPCYRSKRDAFQKRELERARDKGDKVIGARQARSIIPRNRGYMGGYSSDGRHKQLKNGYARPSDKCLDDPKKRTYAELAGKDAPTVMIQDPDTGRVFKAFEIDAIAERLTAKGVKPPPADEDSAAKRARDQAREDAAHEERQAGDIAVFRAVFAAATPKLSREDLLKVAVRFMDSGYGEDNPRLRALGLEAPKKNTFLNESAWLKLLQKFTDAELTRLIVVLPALDGVSEGEGDTPELDALAKRFAVDGKQIRKDAKAAAAPAKDEKPVTKKKKARA